MKYDDDDDDERKVESRPQGSCSSTIEVLSSSRRPPSAFVLGHLDVRAVVVLGVLNGRDAVDGRLAVKLDTFARAAGGLALLQDALAAGSVDVAVARLLHGAVPTLVEAGVASSGRGGRGRDGCARHGHGDGRAEGELRPRGGLGGSGDGEGELGLGGAVHVGGD